MKKWIITAILAAGFAQFCTAQQSKQDLAKVDEYVRSLGPMEGHHLKAIVDTLTHRGTAPKAEQARALYAWIAMNVDYNTAGMRHPNNFNPSASEALNTRKTTPLGYANLFKAMCDQAHLRCQVIPGMAKFDPRNIGKLSPKWNEHTWNAVDINGNWQLLDAAWGAGKTDRKFRYYVKSYTDAWFMTDKELFAMSHFPKDKKWQLLDTPINKSAFTFAPIVATGAIINEVYPTGNKRGNVRGKADTTKKMVFEVGNPELIKTVSVTGRTSTKVPAKFSIQDNLMNVEVPFSSVGDYPFNIYINDQLAYQYKADISEPKKKPKPKPQPKKKPAPKPRTPVAKKAPVEKKPPAEKKKETKEKKTKKEKAKTADEKKGTTTE